MCYDAEFGRSALKDVGINTEFPKLGSAAWNSALLAWETWLTLRYTHPPIASIFVILGHTRVYA